MLVELCFHLDINFYQKLNNIDYFIDIQINLGIMRIILIWTLNLLGGSWPV